MTEKKDPKDPFDFSDESDVTPAIRELLAYSPSGPPESNEAPISPQAKAFLKEVEKLRQERESSQSGPERFIGPSNPDHPNVNREPGGRNSSKT